MKAVNILVIALTVLALGACTMGQVAPDYAGEWQADGRSVVLTENTLEFNELFAGELTADGETMNFQVTRVWTEDGWQAVDEEVPAEEWAYEVDGDTMTIDTGEMEFTFTR